VTKLIKNQNPIPGIISLETLIYQSCLELVLEVLFLPKHLSTKETELVTFSFSTQRLMISLGRDLYILRDSGGFFKGDLAKPFVGTN